MFKRSFLFLMLGVSMFTNTLVAQDSIVIKKPNTEKIKIFIKSIFPVDPSKSKTVKSAIPKPAKLEKVVREIHDDIIPLIVKLKFTYNRPRPYQLSFFKGLKLYPFKSATADSPSYPSGHAYQAKIYAEVLGNIYPKFYKALNDLANDIAWSRLYLGVHYPTDTEFALYMADIVLKHPEFRKKFYTKILPMLKNQGKTIIALTHDDAYYDVADKIIVLDNGKMAP